MAPILPQPSKRNISFTRQMQHSHQREFFQGPFPSIDLNKASKQTMFVPRRLLHTQTGAEKEWLDLQHNPRRFTKASPSANIKITLNNVGFITFS